MLAYLLRSFVRFGGFSGRSGESAHIPSKLPGSS